MGRTGVHPARDHVAAVVEDRVVEIEQKTLGDQRGFLNIGTIGGDDPT
jgi:hypothetical protein